MKYSDWFADYLQKRNFTACYSVGGGNIMHLVESVSKKITLYPVVHEVTAATAAEYFNQIGESNQALALVTTGPGLTNTITAVASAYVESRPLLVVGGQVKRADLALGDLRQIGIQEIDGVTLVKSITKFSERMDEPWNEQKLDSVLTVMNTGRPGPAFIEIPLDVQAVDIDFEIPTASKGLLPENENQSAPGELVAKVVDKIKLAGRPAILLGSGISHKTSQEFVNSIGQLGIPIFTSWNAADRFDNLNDNYFGRPNTWGQRYSNILIQQCDVLLAIGARLGLQQTGFNWDEFVPEGEIIQIDIDQAELDKKRPTISMGICADANSFLRDFIGQMEKSREKTALNSKWIEWIDFGRRVKQELPLSESANSHHEGYWNPYAFYLELSAALTSGDVLVPSSSGSSFTAAYQSAILGPGVRMISSKSLASMGYGLAGAIGASMAKSDGRTILVEGDGGFAQNLQDLGTAIRHGKNLKIFIWDNDGYASIRKTQQSYFQGHYVGCDSSTGLALPDWKKIFSAFDVQLETLQPGDSLKAALDFEGTRGYLIPIHPDQTFLPKIASKISANGSMESNPLHKMEPPLEPGQMLRLTKYLNKEF